MHIGHTCGCTSQHFQRRRGFDSGFAILVQLNSIEFHISVSGLHCNNFCTDKRKNTVFGACFRAYEMSCFLFFAPNPRALISFVHRFFDFSTVAKKLNYPLSTNYWSPIHLYILGSSQRRSWIHGIIPDPRAVLKHWGTKKKNAAENCVYTVALKTNILLRMDPWFTSYMIIKQERYTP